MGSAKSLPACCRPKPAMGLDPRERLGRSEKKHAPKSDFRRFLIPNATRGAGQRPSHGYKKIRRDHDVDVLRISVSEQPHVIRFGLQRRSSPIGGLGEEGHFRGRIVEEVVKTIVPADHVENVIDFALIIDDKNFRAKPEAVAGVEDDGRGIGRSLDD